LKGDGMMEWFDAIERDYDNISEKDAEWMEANYSHLEENLKKVQKQSKYGAEDIDAKLANLFVSFNKKENISQPISQAFLYHWYYLLD
jgi:hypothetical protein